MDNKELLEIYQYHMFKKLVGMHHAERVAYLIELFGKRWTEVYESLTNLYPRLLNAPNRAKLTLPPRAVTVERRVRAIVNLRGGL